METDKAVLPLVAEAVIQKMGAIYPNLAEGRDFVLRVLKEEEERFSQVYETGMRILEEMFDSQRDGLLAGEQAFLLYDTYGFPVEVTAEIAREHGMEVDMEGFQREMEAQRRRGRVAGERFGGGYDAQRLYQEMGIGQIEFLGYETTTAPSVITGLIVNGRPVNEVSQGQEVEVILRETPFYAEGGGQVGDTGTMEGTQG